MNEKEQPYIFDEFFASGLEETISPFLTADSRPWGKNLSLKSALLSAALLIGAFASSFFLLPLCYLLLCFVYFLSGTPALIDTIEDLKNWEVNIDTLMTLAAFLAVLIGSPLEGALLLVLFALSGAMEEAVSHKTRATLHHLHKLSPTTAYVLDAAGIPYQKAIGEIAVGTRILVKAGEVVPLDGVVVEGSSSVNLVHLTGESVPVPKRISEEVQAGSRNLDGTLTLVVTKTSQESTLSRIIALITQAAAAKPKIERFLDRFGKPYALTIIFLSIFFAVGLPFFSSLSYLGLEGSIYRALAFLIAASPCALIIATPTAYLSAINACARIGILLKGGVVLDALASCTAVAFDKTGTLTTGELTCIGLEQLLNEDSHSLHFALSAAASLEKSAVHPISQAIMEYARKKKAPIIPVENFLAKSGYGLEGIIDNIPVFIGHAEYIASQSDQKIPKEIMEGHLSTFLLIGRSLFAFHFLDSPRPKVKETLKELKEKEGLHLFMLTGDLDENARRFGKEIELEEIFSNLRPQDKLEKISQLIEKNKLAMIGDGINDAPALARANVGISMGKIGSHSAIDASDIVFLNDDLSLLPWLYRKARQTTHIVRQNLFLALGVIVCATGPALLGIIPLWLAVILHEGGTLIVGLNSLRLLKK
jgi:heavy metal translocating P-type ATPase